MTIGGALTGTRSATCTSGPGFALMTEMLGWAGINEVPIVITNYQRSGPSTGLPTRHGQMIFYFQYMQELEIFQKSFMHLEKLRRVSMILEIALITLILFRFQ